MNFTRDPIIETIITPKEGFRLVIRCSKGGGHEEFVVDSVQVILLGAACFYRSLEKPKPFLVPASDYEVVEVRETRMVMKLPSSEKGGIKIGGGRDSSMKREVKEEEESPSEPETSETSEPRTERRKEKKRFRRRRGFEPGEKEEGAAPEEGVREEKPPVMFIPPPSTLISETIARYKDIPGFASAFFEKEKEEEVVAPTTGSEESREDEDFFL